MRNARSSSAFNKANTPYNNNTKQHTLSSTPPLSTLTARKTMRCFKTIVRLIRYILLLYNHPFLTPKDELIKSQSAYHHHHHPELPVCSTMKFFITFFALVAAMCAPALAWTEADYAWSCMTQHHMMYRSISIFCENENIEIPSGYANTGVKTHAHLAMITGTCSPAQWVPDDICRLQFYRMCATSTNGAQKMKFFGTNGCQRWVLAFLNQ